VQVSVQDGMHENSGTMHFHLRQFREDGSARACRREFQQRFIGVEIPACLRSLFGKKKVKTTSSVLDQKIKTETPCID
jgi:hypothetical protein